MPRSPNSPRNKSPRSPHTRDSDLSEPEEEENLSRRHYNTRSSSPYASNVSGADDSLQDEGDLKSSKSPLSAESNVRSRIGTHTRGSPASSSGADGSQKMYPDLPDNVGARTKSKLPVSPGSGGDTHMYPPLSDYRSGDGTGARSKSSTSPQTGGGSHPDLQDLKSGDGPGRKRDNFGRESTRYGEKEKPQDEISSNGYNVLYFILIILLGVIGAIYFKVLPSKPTSSPADISVFEKYTLGIDDLRAKFPQQSSRLWRTLKSSAKHVLNDTDPEYPVVILMAAPKENSYLTQCIAELAAKEFQSSLTGYSGDVKTSDINHFKGLLDGQQKEKLDIEMTRTFTESGGKSFVIVNLQALAPEAALILHGFCDNDNAPYKDVMIVMTLHFDPKDLKLNENKRIAEGDVETYLRNLWGRGLVADKVGALLSRVGNNIVLVADEKSESVKSGCRN